MGAERPVPTDAIEAFCLLYDAFVVSQSLASGETSWGGKRLNGFCPNYTSVANNVLQKEAGSPDRMSNLKERGPARVGGEGTGVGTARRADRSTVKSKRGYGYLLCLSAARCGEGAWPR
ncbi:hypothetical protein SAMN05443244_0944 [Terriglobus roseus]|uniref:Uncharacterized protein n=1 Tax=Terriglobus roseus TaxID=392734 RepID=A0A1H4K2B0_9BACT|nr:hypothetical protein SAMN05443244_0944 [Terriglobus roseus]